MTTDECFELGYVVKPHGLNGEVDLFIDSDFPEHYKKLESVFVKIGQKLVPFFIEKIKIRGNKALARFEDITSKAEAIKLKGCTLHLPESFLPALKDQQFYFHEVIGFDVIDQKEGEIGKVARFYEYPNQVFLAVDYSGSEVLIPVNDQIIVKVDKDKSVLKVKLPDGLLDL